MYTYMHTRYTYVYNYPRFIYELILHMYGIITCTRARNANMKYYFVTNEKANVHIPRKATNAK